MRKIQFDSEGLTSECPASDIGNQTSSECQHCSWFKGFEGFDANCKYDEPDVTELPSIWTRAKGWVIRVVAKWSFIDIAWCIFWLVAFILTHLPNF